MVEPGLEEKPGTQAAVGGDVASRVDAAVRPLLASEGFDLVLVEYQPRSHVLRLYIDRLVDGPVANSTENVSDSSGMATGATAAAVAPVVDSAADAEDAAGGVGVLDDDAGGVGVDDCARVSRWVSDVLDAQGVSDTIPGSFSLEVSSPGLDRPLVRPRDFARFLGREAKLTTAPGVDPTAPERRRFTADLVEADPSDNGGVRVRLADQGGRILPIAYRQIEQARLVPRFPESRSPSPKKRN